MSPLLQILLTALLTSVATWTLAALHYRLRGRAQLEALKAELGAEIERRVQAGAQQAGQELLPAFRIQVTEGFVDAMKRWPGANMGETARTVARSGADLLGAGFEGLLKPRPPAKR